MLIVGLTGSIGMGKSTAAAHLRSRGVAVFDADAEVHRLYEGTETVAAVEQAFPGTTRDGQVDRQKLSAALGGRAERFRKLESIVHPLVRAAQRRFVRTRADAGDALVVLEIPLLFESGGEATVDVTIVVSAPPDVQRERVLARPGMTEQKLSSILARQMPDAEKRRRADYVVDTGGSKAESGAQLDAILETIRGLEGRAYETHWA